jgi:hypothetical protein
MLCEYELDRLLVSDVQRHPLNEPGVLLPSTKPQGYRPK